MKPAELSEASPAEIRHGEHIILRLTYISHYNNQNENGEVTRILNQAQQNNARHGITGALMFNHNYFFQSIEGARPVINELLRKLVLDDRHFALQVVECREVEQRRWDKWSMKYLTPTDQNKQHALKFSTGTEFNPYLMSTNQIMMLIDTLSTLQQQEETAPEKKKAWFSIH